jgi:hypothetical protein
MDRSPVRSALASHTECLHDSWGAMTIVHATVAREILEHLRSSRRLFLLSGPE